jgi:hypothetical protein
MNCRLEALPTLHVGQPPANVCNSYNPALLLRHELRLLAALLRHELRLLTALKLSIYK